jgi:hypothetical protein
MQRWTVRNVSADAIRAVQELSGDSGVCLGQIVSEAIERGLGCPSSEHLRQVRCLWKRGCGASV